MVYSEAEKREKEEEINGTEENGSLLA